MSRFERQLEKHRHARHHDYKPQHNRLAPLANPGDDQRLRHIPAVGKRGCAGAIPGTRPDHLTKPRGRK